MDREYTSETGPLVNIGEHRVRLTEQEAQLNLHSVLQLCAAGKLRCSEKTKRPSSATITTVASHLGCGDFDLLDPIASFAWPLLIQAGGLAALHNGRLQLTAKGRTALREPAPEVIRALWRRWVSHALLDEFSRIEEIKGQRAKNVLSAAQTTRRSGTYRDGTHTRRPDPASRTQDAGPLRGLRSGSARCQ